MLVEPLMQYRFRVTFNDEVTHLTNHVHSIQEKWSVGNGYTLTVEFRDPVDGSVQNALSAKNIHSIQLDTLSSTNELVYSSKLSQATIQSWEKSYDYSVNKPLLHNVVFSGTSE